MDQGAFLILPFSYSFNNHLVIVALEREPNLSIISVCNHVYDPKQRCQEG